jgi:hypothetical protein
VFLNHVLDWIKLHAPDSISRDRINKFKRFFLATTKRKNNLSLYLTLMDRTAYIVIKLLINKKWLEFKSS